MSTPDIQQDDAPADTLWWLSFANEEGFLGVSIVSGPNMGAALGFARVLGCNPGGEVQGHPIPPTLSVPPRLRGRLLTRDWAIDLDRRWTRGETYQNGAWVKGLR